MTPNFVETLASIRPYSDRRAAVKELALLLARTVPDIAERTTAPVHATASAFVVDATGGRVLLVWHPKFSRWLQPGGHCDGDTDALAVAVREVREETGLRLELNDPPFDVDVHPGEPGGAPHVHVDIRFVAHADSYIELQSPEGLELRWFGLDDVPYEWLEDAVHGALNHLRYDRVSSGD
jgi:8-oxo-dGTP pyrophosphatase MutT (NUDIX family)